MSDDDNERAGLSTEGEETEESFSQLPLVKTRRRRGISELRHPRQKYCTQWEKDFPWLKADNVDESLGYCKVCKKHLVCKKSHLERHEKSYKHQRQQDSEDMESGVQATATEFLECGKREPDDEEEVGHSIELNSDTIGGDELKQSTLKTKRESFQRSKNSLHRTRHSATTRLSSFTSKSSSNKLDRFKLLKLIDRDRNELNEYYSRKQLSVSPNQPTRDSFDLFFDSVSASVKSLPPKLAAEIKGRVSQIIAEFELRAICEREAEERSINAISSKEPALVIATTTQAVPQCITRNGNISATSTSPHIVYTFQPKTSE